MGRQTGDTDGSTDADVQFHFDRGIEQFLCGLAGTIHLKRIATSAMRALRPPFLGRHHRLKQRSEYRRADPRPIVPRGIEQHRSVTRKCPWAEKPRVVSEQAEQQADKQLFEITPRVATPLERIMAFAHQLGGFDRDVRLGGERRVIPNQKKITNITTRHVRDVRNVWKGKVVPGDGIEPPTLRFSVACSTN